MNSWLKNYQVSAVLLSAMWLFACQPQPSETLAEAEDDTALEHAEKHADPNYVCPMHPQIVKGEPGNCPICGMDLVPVEPEAASGDAAPIVEVSATVQQNLGLRTAPVTRTTLWQYIKTTGTVTYNEDRLVHVHPRASGWVESVSVTSAGAPVKKGQALLRYYSPEIYAAQEELLLSQGGSSKLREAARERLRLLEVPDGTIRQIERRGKPLRMIPMLAPESGVVATIGFRNGMRITPALELYTLAQLDDIWVQVNIFERHYQWVKVGRPAEIRIEGLPGRVWEGEVDYIYPELDAATRSLVVRLRFPNEDGALKPNMFASATVYGGPRRDVLAVPREAVILSGDEARVIKRVEEDRFQPVAVITGMRTRDQIEILDGLEPGDQVVVSAQFLLDSESNLRASLRRLSGE